MLAVFAAATCEPQANDAAIAMLRLACTVCATQQVNVLWLKITSNDR